ncbi:hypothetical protein ASPCAL12403 [Aspergillus calidoustus]|uniref:Uncharacterized protein n=1 Tax=Aspergillus calidoustus TaxID=454130 RepID=A0A0U5GBZ7_ASPCI|nr:hypothetical protein ASPCAL12403 [Aspergillus calidoustus]
MAWSIDTTLSFLSLLITGASSLVVVWDPIVSSYRRIYRRVCGTEPSPTRDHQHPSYGDEESLLEEGLRNGTDFKPSASRRTRTA